MSNRSGKLLSTFFVASLTGSVLAITAHGPARADDTCLSAPKATTPRGSHWYYRIERGTQRHCWYLGAERGKLAQRPAKPRSSTPAPEKPVQASATTPPLQPSVANARAELEDGARDRANTHPPSAEIESSTAYDQASADPSPSVAAPPAEPTHGSDALPPAADTSWPDPAIPTAAPPMQMADQQPAPAISVSANPAAQNEQPPSTAANATARQSLDQSSQPKPAAGIVHAPASEVASYSMLFLLSGLAGALGFAGLLGFAVIRLGSRGGIMRNLPPRTSPIRDAIDTGHLPPWQRRDHPDIAPTPARDPHRMRKEIEAQSRDIMEILSRASRGAAT